MGDARPEAGRGVALLEPFEQFESLLEAAGSDLEAPLDRLALSCLQSKLIEEPGRLVRRSAARKVTLSY